MGYLIAAACVAFAAGLVTWSNASRRRIPDLQYIAVWLCWFGFGFLLNRLGFLVVIIAVAVFCYRLSSREAIEVKRAVPSWTRGLLSGAPLWVAAAALVTLALSLSERLFFAVLAVALGVRLLSNALVARLSTTIEAHGDAKE